MLNDLTYEILKDAQAVPTLEDIGVRLKGKYDIMKINT